MFYLADADLFVIRAKINKEINPGPRRLLYTLLIFLPRSSPPLSPALEFFFFDKRNSGGFLQILESGWSSCIFWERLSRASCKEDVAEERCFLTDKGKASLCQDVWARLGPALKSQRKGREPAVLWAGGNTAVLISISLMRLYLPGIFQDILCQPGQVEKRIHTAEGDAHCEARRLVNKKMTYRSTCTQLCLCSLDTPWRRWRHSSSVDVCAASVVLISSGLDHYPLCLLGFKTLRRVPLSATVFWTGGAPGIDRVRE